MINSRENYARFYTKSPEFSYGKPAKIVEMIPTVLTTGSVLDIGAGDGRHALFLAEKGFAVEAIDTSEAALEKMKKIADEKGVSIAAELGDISHWTFDAEYDAVVAVQIFQHLQTEEALRVLDEVKMHTRPNGVNAISLFTQSGDRYLLDREEDPGAFYPEDNWLKEFYTGWEILEHSSRNGPLIGKTRDDGSPMTSVVERILARKLA